MRRFLTHAPVLELGLAHELNRNGARSNAAVQPVCSATCDARKTCFVGVKPPQTDLPPYRESGRESARVVRLRDRVQIDDREEAVVLGLQPDPILAQRRVSTDVQLAGGLDAAEMRRHWRCKVREYNDLVRLAERRGAQRRRLFAQRVAPAVHTIGRKTSQHDFVTESIARPRP